MNFKPIFNHFFFLFTSVSFLLWGKAGNFMFILMENSHLVFNLNLFYFYLFCFPSLYSLLKTKMGKSFFNLFFCVCMLLENEERKKTILPAVGKMFPNLFSLKSSTASDCFKLNSRLKWGQIVLLNLKKKLSTYVFPKKASLLSALRHASAHFAFSLLFIVKKIERKVPKIILQKPSHEVNFYELLLLNNEREFSIIFSKRKENRCFPWQKGLFFSAALHFI